MLSAETSPFCIRENMTTTAWQLCSKSSICLKTIKVWLDSRSHNIKVYMGRSNFLKREDNKFHISDCQGSRRRWRGDESRHGYRRETEGILLVMEMFSFLAVSMSGFWLQYCSRIWRDVTIGVHESLCIVSCNYM